MLDKDRSLANGCLATPNFLKVKLLGVAQNIRMDSLTQSSISMAGKSLKSKMQSLNSDSSRRLFNCSKMAKATHSGNDSLPSNSYEKEKYILKYVFLLKFNFLLTLSQR